MSAVRINYVVGDPASHFAGKDLLLFNPPSLSCFGDSSTGGAVSARLDSLCEDLSDVVVVLITDKIVRDGIAIGNRKTYFYVGGILLDRSISALYKLMYGDICDVYQIDNENAADRICEIVSTLMWSRFK